MVPPVDEGELNLLAVHAGVGLRVGDPHCSVLGRRLLTRLLQEVINALNIGLICMLWKVLAKYNIHI